jgi:hypothetical protein
MNFNNNNIKSVNLLSDFRKVSIEEVALSCLWWNLHGHYYDKSNKKQSLGCDMNWSYLHFKNHVQEVLYNDVNKLFQEFEQQERGGALFFKLLTDVVLSFNEESLAALESTIKSTTLQKTAMVMSSKQQRSLKQDLNPFLLCEMMEVASTPSQSRMSLTSLVCIPLRV